MIVIWLIPIQRIMKKLSEVDGEKVNDGMDIALVKINSKSRDIEFSGAMTSIIKISNETKVIERLPSR